MPNDLYYARVAATQKTLDKYRGRPFSYGDADCIKAFRSQLVNMGNRAPRLPRYSTERQALNRLAKAGFKSTEDLVLNFCQEIRPVDKLVGDVGILEGEGGALNAVVIYAGRVWMGWPAEEPGFQLVTAKPDRVFRVPCLVAIEDPEIVPPRPQTNEGEITLADYIRDAEEE